MSKIRCRACEFRATSCLADDESVKWAACRHPDLTEIYEGGRALEISAHGAGPAWCPVSLTPKSKVLDAIIPEKQLKVSFIPEANGFRVSVTHITSKICVTLAGDHSFYFTRHRAVKKLAAKIKRWEEENSAKRL